MRAFYERSEHIKDNAFVTAEYRRFARENINNYVMTISRHKRPIIYRIINKMLCHKLDELYIKQYLESTGVVTRNFVECEAHRELLIEGLKEYGK